MSDVKIKHFKLRVREWRGDGSRMLEVIGFEARTPTLSEARLALDLAKSSGLRHVNFPAWGVVQECDTCGVPVKDDDPRASARCSWCRDFMVLSTTRRAEPRMLINGQPVEFGLTAAEINVRAQLCERLGVVALSLAEQFRSMTPTETDTTFALESAQYGGNCTAGVRCERRSGHAGACHSACLTCAGRGHRPTVAHNGDGQPFSILSTCETCDGTGYLRQCDRCGGGGKDPYGDGVTDQWIDCIACEGVGGHPTTMEVENGEN